jgi:carboxyl-terminal processing protease
MVRFVRKLQRPALAGILSLWAASAFAVKPVEDPAQKTFERAAVLVKDHYFDPKLAGKPWDQLVDQYRKDLGKGADAAKLDRTLAALLAELPSSQLKFLTSASQDYWAWRAIFHGWDDAKLRHVGAWFERRGDRWFVRRVFAGSPAAKAGLMRGDEIVSVQGKPLEPVASFTRLAPDAKADIAYRRTPWSAPVKIAVDTVVESFGETMLKDIQFGAAITKVDSYKIAYVALPSATDDRFRVELQRAAITAEAQADALVLDLRDAFGGGDLTYLESFFGDKQRPLYSKPLVVLVNEQTRHGKEWLAWLIQKRKRGVLVGTRTSGSLRPAQMLEISPRHEALVVPVGSVDDPGAELEGQGVIPDEVVEQTLMYGAGADPQLTQAMKRARILATPR